MRILQLLNHTNRLNGHVHAAVDLACAQARLGHEVVVASGGGDFDALLATNNIPSIRVTHERRLTTLLRGIRQLRSVIREWKPDVVHAHMMTSAVLGWAVCKPAGIPLITTVHNEFQKSSILMGLGTRVIAVSDVVGRSMEKRGVAASRLHVVLNGTIGAARFDSRDRVPRRLQSPAIIFVGGLHPRKGLPDLFKAFETIHDRHPESRLYVVGDGPHREEYSRQVAEMACAGAVSFMGAQDDPFPYLLGADIFVLPSHADPAPLVLSEAREAGCAIVATEVDGIPQLLEHGAAGLLVPARDAAALAKAVCSLIDDADALREWRSRSQFKIENLRIERVARETLDIYEAASRQLGGW
jgi:glycosyltransferase involved in cell wall biosynthesis